MSATRKPKSVKTAVQAVPPGQIPGLQDITPDMIITLNEGGIIQSASDSIEKLFGWTPTEVFGRNIKMLIPEPRRSSLDRYLDRYRRTDKNPSEERTHRFDAVRKDGVVFQIELSMSRADIPAHSGSYFIGIIRDVSHEIDKGIESAKYRSQLQRLVTEQTRALATANLRLHLIDRLASLGTLAAGLGHDMSNILLPIQARLNALEHEASSAKAIAHVTAVRRSIAYLQHLSDALHYLSLDPDRPLELDEQKGSTALAEWWTQVGPLLRTAVPKHVTVRATLPASLPPVHISPHSLTQAMLNLIVNAGEAIPEGASNRVVRIGAKVSDEGATVRISVIDNGRGMSKKVQHRAFDIFFTTKPRSMGTGLGLPLARKVAEHAGGSIELTTESGKGTTVTLILPTATPDAQGLVSGRSSRTAVVSISDHRAAALVSQILTSSRFIVKAGRISEPGESDLWVTAPAPKALAAAAQWRIGKPGRVVVVLGAPSAKSQGRWTDLGAVIIDSPGDFGAIRHGLSQAMTLATTPTKRPRGTR